MDKIANQISYVSCYVNLCPTLLVLVNSISSSLGYAHPNKILVISILRIHMRFACDLAKVVSTLLAVKPQVTHSWMSSDILNTCVDLICSFRRTSPSSKQRHGLISDLSLSLPLTITSMMSDIRDRTGDINYHIGVCHLYNFILNLNHEVHCICCIQCDISLLGGSWLHYSKFF